MVIPLQLSGVTSYFDVHSPSVSEYENDDIPKIHLTVKEPLWDPLTNDYSERETQMIHHHGQITIPATVARGPEFVSAVVIYSLAYNNADVMNNDSLVTALKSQVQISIVLINTVREPLIDPIVLAMQWGNTPQKTLRKLRTLSKQHHREGLGLCSTL